MPRHGADNLSWEPFFQRIGKLLETSQLNYFDESFCNSRRKKFVLLLLPLLQVFLSTTSLLGIIRPNKYDVEDKVMAIMIVCMECAIVVKFAVLLYYNKLLRKQKDIVISHTSQCDLEPWEQSLTEKYYAITRLTSKRTWFVYFSVMISFNVLPMFSKKDYLMPILLEIPGTNQSSHPGYEINYILGAYSVYYGTTIHLGFDVPVFMQVFFIALQLEKCIHFCHLIGDFDSEYNTNEKQSELILKCIKFHRSVVEFTQRVGRINTLVAAILIFTAVPIITISLYSLLSGTFGGGPVMMFASTYNLFLYCFLGDIVCNKFREVSESIYDSQWNNIERMEDKRTILLFLTLSQRDVYFSAGGLFRLSLETFAETMKSVYGTCAFLKEVI